MHILQVHEVPFPFLLLTFFVIQHLFIQHFKAVTNILCQKYHLHFL